MAFAKSRPRSTSAALIPEETPFLKAAQEWDRRIGSSVAQARNWRVMAFSCAGIAAIFAGGFVYEATRVQIQAYYVPVNEAGRPGRVMLASDHYTPTQGEVVYFLSDWVRTIFAKPTDGVLAGQDFKRDFSRLRGKAVNTMSEWAQKNDPMQDIGRIAKTVTVNSVLQRTEQTYQVNWTETTYTDGAQSGVVHNSGLFTVEVTPPANQADLLANPLGLYITSITWSHEGSSP
jgi:type IV secretion system protein VirB5